MCRLALMNRPAIDFLGPYLNSVFGYLETALGGHGNGVAGLWIDRGKTKIRKGVQFTTVQAAACARNYAEQGADWVLFHTRRATSSAIEDQHCHPFRARKLVLAHNGHDSHFAQLGRAIDTSDSECITRLWAHMRFPVSELTTRSGVFIGFAEDHPFVVKGQTYSELLAAWEERSGSVLFASELPPWLVEGVFDRVVSLGTIQWFGRDLDPQTLDVRPYRPRPVVSAGCYQSVSSEGLTDGFGELLDEAEVLYDYAEEAKVEKDWRLQRQVERDRYSV